MTMELGKNRLFMVYLKEMPARRHGMCNTSTYSVWENMWQRVRNPKRYAAHRYIGRGITVCSRWKLFENFLVDMGERPPGLSLDRIDNDKGYSPDNCKWSTQAEQFHNSNDHPRREAVRRMWRTYRAQHSKPCIDCGTMFHEAPSRSRIKRCKECRLKRQ
jgi:hypothetical protein